MSKAHAGSFKEYKKHIVETNNQCISEANAKLTVERLLKDFPPNKEVLLSFERSSVFYIAAPTLKAYQPYLKASREEQFEWMDKFLKDSREYYANPATTPWTIEYRTSSNSKSGDQSHSNIHKKFPKKKNACVTGVFIRSPKATCVNNERLRIGFSFESGGSNNSALLSNIALTPIPCDL